MEGDGLAPGAGPPLTSYPIIPVENPMNPFAYGHIGKLLTAALSLPTFPVLLQALVLPH